MPSYDTSHYDDFPLVYTFKTSSGGDDGITLFSIDDPTTIYPFRRLISTSSFVPNPGDVRYAL